jgi:hypothetical protein
MTTRFRWSRGVLMCGLLLHASLAAAGSERAAAELEARILRRLAPTKLDGGPDFCFRFSYAFEDCELVTRQTWCMAPPPKIDEDWSESVSRAPLGSLDPERIRMSDPMYLYAAGDRDAIENRERWSGEVGEGRPLERLAFGHFHAYWVRSEEDHEPLKRELQQLIRLCGGGSVPPAHDPPPLVRGIAGVRIGPDASTNEEVTARLGPGLTFIRPGYRDEGRYFIDPDRSLTLQIRSQPAPFVNSVKLTAGVVLPGSLLPTEPKLVSPFLASPPLIDHGLELGMSPEQVVGKLGRPQRDYRYEKERRLSYEVRTEQDPRVRTNYLAILQFEQSRLVSLEIIEAHP